MSREYLLHHRVCPAGYTACGELRLASDGAPPRAVLDDLGLAYGADVVAETAEAGEIERMIERLANRSDRMLEVSAGDQDDFATDVRNLANEPPVVRYVNLLVTEARAERASDVHLEMTRGGLVARFRVDGVLVPAPEPPAEHQLAVISRLKLLASLDIAERRRPQDGRIRVRLADGELDLRVSTVPTMLGESVVLRLLDMGGRPQSLSELGMPDPVLRDMVRLSQRPHGLVLVTGPTGSGKTTTLYAALAMRNHGSEKVVTIEDPVEYHLSDVVQVPVHRQAGVTFASALRSILRQDPDVLMIGETRDAETAEMIVQAALTGHLVYSTLHTNDATGAVPRLLDLGVPPYLISATLDAVLAQRLVRRLCDRCKVPAERQTVIAPGREPVAGWRAVGCEACRGTGFWGRVGLFELLVLDERMKQAVASGRGSAPLRGMAEENGFVPLLHDGIEKVREGLTTSEEVVSVAQD